MKRPCIHPLSVRLYIDRLCWPDRKFTSIISQRSGNMPSPAPDQEDSKHDPENNADAYASLIARIEALEEALEEALRNVQQAAPELDSQTTSEPDVQTASVTEHSDQPTAPIPQRQLQHFSSIEEAMEAEERHPVALADDDILEVKSNQKSWVPKILSALHARIRDEPMAAGDSVDEWKRKWSSFVK